MAPPDAKPKQSRWRKIWVVGLALGIAGLGILLSVRDGDDFVYEGKRLSVWFDGLLSQKSTERVAAEKVFTNLGPKAVPFLTSQLKDDSRLTQRYRSFYDSKIRSGPQWLRSWLPTPSLHNADTRRLVAAYRLGKIGPAASPAIPELAKLLKCDYWNGASFACSALTWIGTNSVSALPQLTEQLGNNDRYTADHVAQVIRIVAKDHSNAVPALVAVLRHTNDAVKVRALSLLPAMRNAKFAERDIEVFLKSPNPALRFAALSALWDISPDRHEELLDLWVEFATSSDKQFHTPTQLNTPTCWSLLKTKPLTNRAVALAAPLVEEMDEVLRFGTYALVASLGNAASNATPVLIKGLRSKEPRAVAKAAEALGKSANPTPEVIQALQEAMEHEYLMVRDAAAAALKDLQSRRQP